MLLKYWKLAAAIPSYNHISLADFSVEQFQPSFDYYLCQVVPIAINIKPIVFYSVFSDSAGLIDNALRTWIPDAINISA